VMVVTPDATTARTLQDRLMSFLKE
jgi:hypothetical protein